MQMTAEECYTANMAMLSRHPAEDIRQMPGQLAHVPLANVTLIPNGRQDLIVGMWDVLTQRWVGLCDGDDPQGQAERDVDAIYSPDVRVFTLLGLGGGHAAVALARRLRPYQRLSIWDISPVLFRTMFYCVDATPLFSDKRVHLYIGPEILHSIEPYWLSMDAAEKLHLGMPLRAGYTTQMDIAAYDALMAKTTDMLRHHMVGLSTWRMFGPNIVENDLANLPEYFLTPGYDRLAGLWQDRPAVCVAAGPSLHANLHILCDPALRDTLALITVGTMYATLQGLGLLPDIVTTIDFQRLNWTDQFLHVPLDPGCPLVYLHSTYPQTVRRWPGPRFVAQNASDTVSWFSQYAEPKASAAQVQTVAHLNLLVALMLGANPICLIGQDLSMPYATHHAAGARAQDQSPAEVPTDAFLPTGDYLGNPTYTRHSFLSMKTVFERIAAEAPGRTILNCSEGGLALAGIPNVPLAEALASWRGQPSTGEGLRQACQRVWQGYTPQIAEQFPAALGTLHQQLTTILDDLCPALEREAAHWQAQQAGEYTDATGDEEARAHTMATLLGYETTLQQLQPMFGLFVLRDFRLVELLSAIPEGDAWLTDPHVAKRLACERMCAIAPILRANGPTLRRLVQGVTRRLAPLLDPHSLTIESTSMRQVLRCFARQHYAHAFQLLRDDKHWDRDTETIPVSRWLRLWAQYLLHTQQYAAFEALTHWGFVPTQRQRVQQRVAQYQRDVRTLLPAYFATPGTWTLPPVVALEQQCGFAIGA